MRCLSLSGLRWAKKTGIFILGILALMTVDYISLSIWLSSYLDKDPVMEVVYPVLAFQKSIYLSSICISMYLSSYYT